jgi:hypothetical protein
MNLEASLLIAVEAMREQEERTTITTKKRKIETIQVHMVRKFHILSVQC